MVIKKLQDLQTFDENKLSKSVVFQEEKSKTLVFNFLPGQMLSKHGHPHKNAYVFVVSGEGKCYLDDQESSIQSGDVIHCNPNQTIGIENTGTEPMTVYVVLAEV